MKEQALTGEKGLRKMKAKQSKTIRTDASLGSKTPLFYFSPQDEQEQLQYTRQRLEIYFNYYYYYFPYLPFPPSSLFLVTFSFPPTIKFFYN